VTEAVVQPSTALERSLVVVGLLASAALLGASAQSTWPDLRPSTLEAVAVVSTAWSAWLLARNAPLGWWVGLVGCFAYAELFLGIRLRAEVGLQVFYVITSLQGIWIWLRGGPARTERPVGRMPRWSLAPGILVLTLATAGTAWLVSRFKDPSAPVADALVTVLSIAAQLLLMGRYVESWILWVLVDTIAVPLYAWRGLSLTAGLYAVLWVVAARGLVEFERAARAAEAKA
jgi:nicotinamide mononucleotide transporter